MALLAVLVPSPLLRAGFAALLKTMGFEPVEEAQDLSELKRRLDNAARPDILLISLTRCDDIAKLIHDISSWAPDTKIVFLAAALNMPVLSACFAAGAAGYLLEGISRDGLQHSLRLVNAGEKVFPSDLAGALAGSAFKSNGPLKIIDELRNLQATDLEIDILRCVASGQSNSQIGKTLGISETDVSAHIKNIRKKLRVSNRTQAALWGVAKGLASPYAALARYWEH